MKLTTAQIQNVVDQVQADPVPEQHPTMPQLQEVFGPHTFFLNAEGLHVVEPSEKTDSGKREGHFIKLASWNDEERTALATHDAQLSGTVEIEPDEEPDTTA